MTRRRQQTTEQTTVDLEAHIVRRYQRWKNWNAGFGYKHRKGSRIASIVEATGGLPARALEVGVGPGGVASAFCKRGSSVVGVDLSPEALLRAKVHCSSDPVALVRASGFTLPFRGDTFDVVYCSQVLHLFATPDRLALMKEVSRVLHPGGRFVFDMKNIASHPIQYLMSTAVRRRTAYPGRAEIMNLLVAAGFEATTTWPGVLPRSNWRRVPNLALLRAIAHTTFFVARRAHRPFVSQA